MVLNSIQANFVVIVFYMLVVYVYCGDHHEKRILLNDPNYVQQQVLHLQGDMQILQTTVQTQTSELQNLRTTVQTQDAKLQNQTRKIASLEQQLAQANTETIALKQRLAQGIHGYAGGSWYDDSGAAANYLCLPTDPEWITTKIEPDDFTGRLYGAEYDSYAGHSLFGAQSHNTEVPCSVCRSTTFVSSVMLPARTSCYSGWTKAYSGSLSSGSYSSKAASQYVCVDENAQSLPGGADTDDDGVIFLGVKAFCGSLRCPPYHREKFIACVVCMK